jgi:hypothetical protein
MQTEPRAWVIRSKPHYHVRLREFLEGNLVAIGWPGLADLTGAKRDQLDRLLRTRPRYRLAQSRELTVSINILNNFVNEIAKGDYAIVPSPRSGPVFVGKFVGGYRYAADKDSEEEGYPHQRTVQWLNKLRPIDRQQLPPGLRKKVGTQHPLLLADSVEIATWLEATFGPSAIALPQVADPVAVGGDVDSDELKASLEGEISMRLTPVAKRDQELRLRKIRRVLQSEGRLRCEVPGCGFDFFETYGKLGEEFAIVHHTKQLATYDGPKETRLADLNIVCANCHAIIHRYGGCRPLDELIPKP